MVLQVHHMEISQSERILFLCEELGIPYNLIRHKRAPLLAPDSLRLPANPTGKAPFLEDPDEGVALAESGAICEYILAKSGDRKLSKKYGDKGMFLMHSHLPADDATRAWSQARLEGALKHVDGWLAKNKWLAGEDFTAADIMTVYTVTTQRYFGPSVSLAAYPNMLRWLKDVSERPGYRRAMEKGDPEMELLLGSEAPGTTLIKEGGIESGIWKKK
ncbi:glutathione S-transferase-like protein [Paraphaeosphaeria sporulosa]|uniref:Glutathione S-transferas-like protein n=1 Tax=Paraphaeosphaeria sporulosa TaxID=1460663 RepID=A0A177BYL6_9PLEO|nr:glutathione S-transferase-like protein [Paraphaeosphaeria sporulosa]OAF99788.1 glutathione S-transferas-like protein [Paraphaeosphaeria sporulosa]